ncbi:MAG: SOS response-associated peptidase [Pirellulaceae bacterium]
MCGRFTLRTPASVLIEQFGLDGSPQLKLRFNIAPTQLVAAIRVLPGESKRHVAMLRWGLVPSWAKDPAMGHRMINARAETAAEKPSFRSAFRRRRCLVLADGYYEWKKVGSRKQPYYFRLSEGRAFAFAGLWEVWREGEASDDALETCTIMTTEPNELGRPIHDRMPVIIDPENYDEWMDPRMQDRERIEPLLRPYDANQMTAEPVSTYVNNVRNDDAKCIEIQRELF